MIRKLLTRRGIFTLSSILAIVLFFSACTKDNDDMVQQPVAAVMAFNLVPDQQAVQFALSGNVIPGGPLSYTRYTGSYFNVFPGNRLIESYNPTTNTVIDSLAYTFQPDKYYSLFIVGANGNYQNIVSADNYDSLTASSGKAYVRYINAIPDSSDPKVTIAAGGTNVVNGDAAFGSISDFVAVTPGELQVDVTNEGSVDANRTITVAQQKAYTILLTGLPNQADSDKAVAIRFIENGTVTD